MTGSGILRERDFYFLFKTFSIETLFIGKAFMVCVYALWLVVFGKFSCDRFLQA